MTANVISAPNPLPSAKTLKSVSMQIIQSHGVAAARPLLLEIMPFISVKELKNMIRKILSARGKEEMHLFLSALRDAPAELSLAEEAGQIYEVKNTQGYEAALPMLYSFADVSTIEELMKKRGINKQIITGIETSDQFTWFIDEYFPEVMQLFYRHREIQWQEA